MVPTIDEIRTKMHQIQKGFGELLETLPASSLQASAGDDPWSPAIICLHMAEARRFYAGELERVVASGGTGRYGRDPNHHMGRLNEIEIASQPGLTVAVVEQALATSYQQIDAALASLQGQELSRELAHVTESVGMMTIHAFTMRYVLGHHQMHLSQLREVVGQLS